jgi:hypothetical protein
MRRSFTILCLFFFLSLNIQASDCVRAIISPGDLSALENEIFSLKMNIEETLAMQSYERPFQTREELRAFMFDKFGENWTKNGSSLLQQIASGNKQRDLLSQEDKLLADGTLLFKSLDLALTRIDFYEEEQSFKIMSSEFQIQLLEATLDWFTLNPHRPPPKNLMDDNEKHKKTLESLAKHSKLSEQYKEEISQEKEQLDELSKTVAYQIARKAIGYYPYNATSAWQALGYTNAPYAKE